VLRHDILEQVLTAIPRLTLGVLGDLFLDRYLDIDAGLTEPSLETGLDAYQVVGVRPSPGAAGTVLNNLVALGVGRLEVVAVIGDDGEGYELRQALDAHPAVGTDHLLATPDRRTPTYTKPILHQPGREARELNRLDIKNRSPLPAAAEDRVFAALESIWPRVDALVVLDQVSEADCGVVTGRVRRRLAELGESQPDKLILADSRERIGLFRSVWLKPNQRECERAVGGGGGGDSAALLARQAGRPVFCTQGERGILVADPRHGSRSVTLVPTYPVSGPIDIVGAGDSTSAGIACALAAGAGLEEAAGFGNLVASITIRQVGTTGTASPDQVRRRWQEVAAG
jgi:bifunctional ADP-heptose synthase (sugar kinase/adenylyltransferase)